MKKRLFYSIIGIFVFIFMFFGVANKTPLDLSTPADAFMEITEFEFEYQGRLHGEYHLTYECDVCGTTWVLGGGFDGYRMPESTKQQLVWDNMTDREKSVFPGYCEYCYFEHLCTGCYKEIEDCEKYCKECMKCNDCWDQSKHCNECCEENTLCDGCLGIGEYRCIDCHSSDDFCFNCETCLIAAGANGNVCESDDPKPHCLDCCEDWRCDGCAECFLGRQDDYCLNCYECLSCAAAASDHCKECYVCFDVQEACEGTDDFCRPCCVAAGNHCDECDEHIDDNWCEGGMDGRHCRDCAEANDWICEQCDRCAVCNDFSFCDECGLCFECCSENAANEGCECLEYCVESADFTDEAHLCQQCFYAFSCAEEFCDTCGLCKECCEMNADEYGCTCGLCVEDSEFEEHLCEQCGLPTCERGDFCDECGLCEECCLENSEAEGCSCGICIENSDFEDPDHKCADCGQFSCNIDFCEYCGLCLDCCESNSSTEYGCSHGVCTDNPEWNDHYCDTCGKCKEDCDCGQECCADPWAGKSVHGTDVQIGEILIQPFNKKKHVTRDNMSARQASLATFRTKVYDPNGNLNYQWYQKKNGGAPEALVDNTRYVEYRDETFIIVDGAATPRLTVATPSDACHVNYTYYCVISDSHGNVLSTTDEARLVGKHTYEWKWEDDHFHRQVCIGSGCGDTKYGMRKVHDIGPWRFLSYATATTGATLARTCNVCGGISESIKTEPLGANHTAHDYIYIPVTQTDKNGKEVSYTHIKVCRCGKSDGLEEYHDWNQWIVTEAADDHHKGSKYHECLKCNYRETVEIPIQTHEHIFNLHEYDAAFYRVGADRKYHWQYCGDPDCEAVAFKEEHTYGGWMWQLNVPLALYDATICRECQVCGYIDVRTIRAGFHPLAFINASKSVLSADNWDSEEKYTCEVTAKPPKGYTFYRWRDTGECGIIFEEYYETYPNGDPKRDSNGNIIWKRYNVYDETVVISLDRYDKNGNFHDLNTLYELTAEISRIDNDVKVYYPDGFSYTLTEGEALDAEEFGIDGTGDVIWYESQVEDEYGYRTVTIHLDGYDGGPLLLENTGLPCDFNIVVDGDSTITANGQNFAILGCYTGGNIKISSSNGAELRLNVRSGKGAEVYGIKARRAKKWFGDKITICGDILVQLDVTNTRSDGEAFGLYSSSWVEILDQASVEMTIRSYADYLGDDKAISATGVYAKKELQIDTAGYIDIVVHDVDVSNGMKGRGINAKDVIIDNIGSMTVVYPANSKNAYKRKVSYDHKAYIFYAYDDGKRNYYRNGALADVNDVKKLVIEPGYPVTFDVASGSTLNVDYLYTNDLGDYMIKPGDDLIFYTAPASGHYKENVREGAKVIKPSSSDDGVRTKYVLENITAPHTFTVDTGYLFRPFDSQPALSQTDVFFGSEAIVTFTMNNVFSALEGHAKFDGDKPTTPKFALKKLSGGAASSGDLISHGQTANEVFLQRYNEETEFFENTGISFEPTALGNVSFNDEEYSSRLATVRYRLMVLYDGMEYCSDEFTVHWTDNENDRTTPVASAVEIYIKKALRGYPLGVYEDGGAWERLGSEYELLVYDVDQGKGYVETKNEYNKAVNVKKNRKLLKVAEFDYHTGLLTLYGDLQGADFDGDGNTEWYNLSDFLVAIRVPSTVNGGITIDVREETNISGHYEDFGNEGWYGSGGLENVTHTGAIPAVIQNESEYGSVHITSTTESDAFLILERTGTEYFEGITYYGIKANGDVTIDGDVNVQIFSDAKSGYEDAYGKLAYRIGVYAEGDVNVIQDANLDVAFEANTNGTAFLKGKALGVKAQGSVNILDYGWIYLYCEAKKSNLAGTYYMLEASGLNIAGHGQLSAYGEKEIDIPVYIDGDAFISTTGKIELSSKSSNGAYTNCIKTTGDLVIKEPTTILFEYLGRPAGGSPVYEGDVEYDGDVVCYLTDGAASTKEEYYPGVPYTVAVETDYGAADFGNHEIIIKRNGVEISQQVDAGYLNVCKGDFVTYTAAEALDGYRFDGWVVESSIAPEDLVINGREISFMMPDKDLKLHAVYSSYAFEEEPPYFIITNKASTEGKIHWRIDTGESTLYGVDLEYLHTSVSGETEWRSFSSGANGWRLSQDIQAFMNPSNGEYIYKGASLVGLAGSSTLERVIDTNEYKTFRIHAWGINDYYSQPFTIDFAKGIHVLLSEDRENPGLAIPADYMGTEYLVNFAKYVYSDVGPMSYSLNFADLFGPISPSVCQANMFENGMLRFIRNGAHSAVYGIEGSLYVTATDETSGRSFKIPFDFGEIYECEVYPLIVAGKKVTERNKDNVFGDGTVSYDPDTKTLTLHDATIDEIYPMRSDAELTIAAYAILSVQDLNINLVGENVINVSRNSLCHTQAVGSIYTGNTVGIGNVINDTWRPYLTESDDFRINISGEGSLEILIDGFYGDGIHSIGDVTIDGGNIRIKSEYSGISSETGSFVMNYGTLDVDTAQRSCVALSGSDARFTINGGTVSLNGGTDSYVVSMGPTNYQNENYMQLNDGELRLDTKSATYDLTSRTLYYTDWMYKLYGANGNNAMAPLEYGEVASSFDHLKYVRQYAIWVNGKQLTSENLEVQCGRGYAFYVPEVNTLYLNNAQITKGVAYWNGPLAAAGIRSQQPVNVYFSGCNSIDLSSKEYYEINGDPYELQSEETENSREIFGIEVSQSLGFDDYYLGIYGTGYCTMTGMSTGISAGTGNMPIIIDGPGIQITDSDGGIEGEIDINSGYLGIEADYFSIYGLIDTSDYSPIFAYGGASKTNFSPVDMSVVENAANKGWGYDYPFFRLHNRAGTTEQTIVGDILEISDEETKIGVSTEGLAKEVPTDVIVIQYKNGRVTQARVVTVYPSDYDDVILLTFGTDKNAKYRVYALDKQLKPLTDVYNIGTEE